MKQKIKLNTLIGEKINCLAISNNQECLFFYTESEKKFYLETYSECCSETWFSDIIGVDALLTGVITACEYVNLPENYNLEDGRCRQDSDEGYGIKITTDKGYCDIIYRNSSNGYYGGSAELYLADKSILERAEIDIIADWQA